MVKVRTSVSHPIRVDFLPPDVAPFPGRIGMTFAPGKYQPEGATGRWERDLSIDARELAEKHHAHVLVSLVEDHELRALKIEGLAAACEARHIRVLRRPFPDQGVPSMELAKVTVTEVLDAAARGENVVIHCKGGLGRTGVIAACALVAAGVDPAMAMAAVRKARPETIENQAQEKFIEAFAKSGFRFAAASALEPLDRLSASAQELMTAHPPRWRDTNKQIVFDISTPPGSVHRGQVEYSRWGAMPLPSSIDIASAAARLRHCPGFYEYGAPAPHAVEWYVNFADSSLFGFYEGGLFAQDEMQVTEHPALGSLRDALRARGMKALTVENGQPTPALVMGVERRCRVATNPDASAGRPHGLYGNQFARATEAAIRRATERLDPPTRTNVIAIAAPQGGRGAYTKSDIEHVLRTAHSGFRAAVLESKRISASGAGPTVVVHTGWWGCGAFGGNRVLMAALQLIAAEMAGVDQLAFHSASPPDEASLNEAVGVLRDLAGSKREMPTAALVEQLAAKRFPWGVGNGT